MQILEDGGYAISDRIDIPGEGTSDFVFGRGWLLEIVELASGDYYFYSDGAEVRPPSSRFGIFYPCFTFVRASSRDLKGEVFGVGSEHMPEGLPTSAFLFETDRRQPFTRTNEALEVLNEARTLRSIDVCTTPSLVSLKAKKLIDENYSIYPSIARIADRLTISHAHLSRQFKKDYGLSPSGYLHQLRVADATFRLSLGQEIIDISHDVGYNDLSRFYKQFRKTTRTSPAVCREILSGE
jgi:AraC-like DNA-binding protein